MVGDDLDELTSEIDKLATWAAGETITLRDVERMAAGRAETAIFSLTDAWGRRDVGAVLALGRGDHGAFAPAALGRADADHRVAREPRRPRAPLPEARRRRHPPEGRGGAAEDASVRAEKAFAQAANFSAEELGDALVRLAELDAAAKGGSRLPADLELERALVDVTRGRAALELGYAESACPRRGGRPAPCGGRRCSCGASPRGGPVEPADELAVLLADRGRVAVLGGRPRGGA